MGGAITPFPHTSSWRAQGNVYFFQDRCKKQHQEQISLKRLIFNTFFTYYLGDQIKKNELVGRSNNQKRYEKCVYNLNCKSKGKKNKGQRKRKIGWGFQVVSQ
jgi:hypothetical protein